MTIPREARAKAQSERREEARPGEDVGNWVKLKAVDQSETKPGRLCCLLHTGLGTSLLGSPSSY